MEVENSGANSGIGMNTRGRKWNKMGRKEAR